MSSDLDSGATDHTVDRLRPLRTERGSAPPLAAETVGEGPRLVLAHGFTQTGRIWMPVAEHLEDEFELVLADLPGHGGSASVTVGLDDAALLLGETCGPAAYVGYSMGARVVLHLALARPDLVDALVLISGTAGIEDDAERTARRAADDELALEIERSVEGDLAHGGSDDRAAVERFLRRWLDNPLFAGIHESASGFEARMANTAAGLASSLRLCGTGTQAPLWDRLGELEMPVLVITGEDDHKFTELGRRMTAAIGDNAWQVVVERAGHAPQLQQPERVAQLIEAYLTLFGGLPRRPRAVPSADA